MAKKKVVVEKEAWKELGYTFPVMFTLLDTTDCEFEPEYQVDFSAYLPSGTELSDTYFLSELDYKDLVSLTNPKMRKAALQQEIKTKQSELDVLVKQLSEIK